MIMFKSESELTSILEFYDRLIRDCVSGSISFDQFLKQYDSFYMSHALDGHESDFEEQNLLKSYENRIAPHREIWESVVGAGLCSDTEAVKDEYIKAGRFGRLEATKRIAIIAKKYSLLKGT